MTEKILTVSLTASLSILNAQVILLDDPMDSPLYTSFSLNASDSGTNPDDDSFEGFQGLVSGGNPGAVLEVTHFMAINPIPDAFDLASLQSVFPEGSVTYVPSTTGTITDISFSLDLKTDAPFNDVFFFVSDSIGGSAAGFTTIPVDDVWHTISVTGLAAADFGGRDFAGSAPLSFGFGFTSTWNLSPDGAGGYDPEEFVLFADNFKVSINSVPEPSTAIFGTLAVFGMTLRRKR